jgi:uncharacterized protein YdeI (YjbR/CyaY-like superfamily)
VKNLELIAMPVFFQSSKELRAWFDANRTKRQELKLGIRAKPNGHACVSQEEARAEAMRYAWGVDRKIVIDTASYALIFKPYEPGGRWNPDDVALAEALIAQGKMPARTLKLFEARAVSRAKPKAAEGGGAELSPLMMAELKRHSAAWSHFQRMPLSHQRKWSAWVMQAKQEETRARRFARLLFDLGKQL